MSYALAADDATFADVIEAPGAGVALVDFWAAWCGPCRFLSPVIDSLAAEYAGRVRVVKLDVDLNPRTAKRFDIRSIPTVKLFKNGEVVAGFSGLASKATIAALLDAALSTHESRTEGAHRQLAAFIRE